MLKPIFCYRISAEAGLALDEVGNHVSCITQANFENGKLLNQKDYNSVHEDLRKILSEQMAIPEAYFKCISQEEYDEKHRDDR